MPATIFGVPTHPLAVHAAVVLVPLAAIAVVIAALWPAVRRRYGPVVLILATLALVSVPVAKESGESLARRLPGTPLIQQHIALADGLLPWAAGLWIAAVAVVALPWVWWLATPVQSLSRGIEPSTPVLVSAGPQAGTGGAPSAVAPARPLTPPHPPGAGPAGTRGDRLASRLRTALPPGATARIVKVSSWQRPIAIAAATLALVTAVGSTVEIVRIGHSGAKAVWSGTPTATP